MDNVIAIYGCAHLPTALRNIADQLEAGDFGETDEATLIFPGASEVFHLGAAPHDDNAGPSALLNAQCAVTKISRHVIDCMEGQ